MGFDASGHTGFAVEVHTSPHRRFLTSHEILPRFSQRIARFDRGPLRPPPSLWRQRAKEVSETECPSQDGRIRKDAHSREDVLPYRPDVREGNIHGYSSVPSLSHETTEHHHVLSRCDELPGEKVGVESPVQAREKSFPSI